ncbi:MAG TPA: hypothetical protein VMW68_02995 [Methyloceanibacter sp.]|nr:hypothetical protein [Methyloceanibacter sp.]
MNRLRATIVALLTLAVATLPAAGASASMMSMSSSGAGTAMHAECAKHAEAATKADDHASHHVKADAVTPNPAKGHCADHGACGKCLCLGLTAVLTQASGAQPARLPVPASARVAVSLIGPAYLPPSPPPRP